MSPEEHKNLLHNSILPNGVEHDAPVDPIEQLVYYTEQRLDALLERDWQRYNLVGRRIVDLLDERPPRL